MSRLLPRLMLVTFLLVVVVAKGASPLAWAASPSTGPFAAGVVAAEPTGIEGPAEVAVGRPVFYSVLASSSAGSIAFFPGPALTVGPPHLRDGHALFWTERPGTYTINAMEVVVDWEAKTIRLIPHSKTVVVGTPGPEPKPDPKPKPDPEPPGVVDFAVVVWEAADPFQEIQIGKDKNGKPIIEKVNWGAVTSSQSVRKALGGRYFPIDDDETNLSPGKAAFVARYKADLREPHPWIYLCDKDWHVLHEQRHPTTAKATVDLIGKYRGKD